MAVTQAPRSKKSSPKAAAKRPAAKAKPSRGKPTKDPKGGLTAAGRGRFAAADGSHLRPGVTGEADTPQKKVRKGSFLRRHFANPQGPMTDAAGRPTRLALSAHAWGEPVPQSPAAAKKLAAKGKALLAAYHAETDGPAKPKRPSRRAK